jgi:hypothetical protein
MNNRKTDLSVFAAIIVIKFQRFVGLRNERRGFIGISDYDLGIDEDCFSVGQNAGQRQKDRNQENMEAGNGRCGIDLDFIEGPGNGCFDLTDGTSGQRKRVVMVM